MEMLNYKKLIKENPYVYESLINQAGQKVQFVEHPTMGDQYPVIAIIHEYKAAACTDFFDCCDFYENSEYNPVYVGGAIDCAFKLGFE